MNVRIDHWDQEQVKTVSRSRLPRPPLGVSRNPLAGQCIVFFLSSMLVCVYVVGNNVPIKHSTQAAQHSPLSSAGLSHSFVLEPVALVSRNAPSSWTVDGGRSDGGTGVSVSRDSSQCTEFESARRIFSTDCEVDVGDAVARRTGWAFCSWKRCRTQLEMEDILMRRVAVCFVSSSSLLLPRSSFSATLTACGPAAAAKFVWHVSVVTGFFSAWGRSVNVSFVFSFGSRTGPACWGRTATASPCFSSSGSTFPTTARDSEIVVFPAAALSSWSSSHWFVSCAPFGEESADAAGRAHEKEKSH